MAAKFILAFNYMCSLTKLGRLGGQFCAFDNENALKWGYFEKGNCFKHTVESYATVIDSVKTMRFSI